MGVDFVADERIGAVILARVQSSRLPGKVLRPLAGRPMLERVIERASASGCVHPVVVATSTGLADGPIHLLCQKLEVPCFRGAHENVAARVLAAIRHFRLDAFVRICADSPLIDPQLIRTAVELYRTGRYDIVTNNLHRTFPAGQTVELIRAQTFRDGFARMHAPEHFEHVTRFFYEHAEDFRVFNFTAKQDFSAERLVVDTPDDLARMDKLIRQLETDAGSCSLRDILEHTHTLAT